MRRQRSLVIGSVMAVGVLALSGTAQADRGSGTSGRGGGAESIEAQDDCEPASFDAAVGPGTCIGDGDTTFEDFIGQLVAEGAADDWEFHSDDVHIDRGERLRVVGVGGEAHTFTRVDEFAGGCVPELNAVLGLEPLAQAFCDQAFATTLVPAGGTLRVSGADLQPGLNFFQCVIHPWMQATVEVRADHHHHH